MKKTIAFLLLLFAFPLACFADIAYEPPVSDYYEKVQDQVERIERIYLANDPRGFVVLLDRPHGDPLNFYENGQKFFVYGSYKTDECCWAYIARDEQGELSNPGWIEMESLAALYTSFDFKEEHAGEQYKTHLGNWEWPAETEYLYLFEYPGCGEEPVQYILRDQDHQEMGPALSFHWGDSQGRQWAFLGYYKGRHNKFVCLDDPQNPAPFEETTTGKLVGDVPTYSAQPVPEIMEKEAIPKENLKPLAAALVAGAMALSLILLFLIAKSKKKQ